MFDLYGFIVGQTPKTPVPAPLSLHPSSIALAYQVSNLYLLMFMVGVGVLYSTSEPRVVRNYLVACAVADVGHVYVTYLAMGWDAFVDVKAWNALTWGNIGVTAFLLVNRIAYFAGLFGYVKTEMEARKTKKEA